MCLTKSTPVNCKADGLSAFCKSRAKMSAIRTRHDKTTLLVTKGDNGHFRTLRAITYKKISNKSNAILAACLHLLATFGSECRAFAFKKNTICKKVGGGASAALPLPVRRLCIQILPLNSRHTEARNVSRKITCTCSLLLFSLYMYILKLLDVNNLFSLYFLTI